jgi:hypothetical protein
MMNLLEIMQAAQGGNAYNNLAQKFGIGPDQAQQAVQSVLPAISMSLQQQAQSIEGWQNILSTLGQSQASAETFDSDGDGIPDALENEGQNALGAMFGGPEVSQAVAAQAAHFAGLPATIMQQMLPVIASMVIGGLFKGAANNGLGGILGQIMQGSMGGAGMGGAGGNVLGNILGSVLGGGQPQQQAGGGNILGSILGSVLGGGQAQRAPQSSGNIMGDLLGQMMGGAKPAPQPQAADPVAAGLDALKGMFETGHKVQNQQLDAFGQILSQFTKKA